MRETEALQAKEKEEAKLRKVKDTSEKRRKSLLSSRRTNGRLKNQILELQAAVTELEKVKGERNALERNLEKLTKDHEDLTHAFMNVSETFRVRGRGKSFALTSKYPWFKI